VASPNGLDSSGNTFGPASLGVPAHRRYASSTYDNFSKDRDDIENILILPCVLYLYLAISLRRQLRRWVGRGAGNAIGTLAIVFVGGPPIVFACATVVLFRLVFWSLGILDKVRCPIRSVK
jgi:hypothetical protein